MWIPFRKRTEDTQHNLRPKEKYKLWEGGGGIGQQIKEGWKKNGLQNRILASRSFREILTYYNIRKYFLKVFKNKTKHRYVCPMWS